MNGRQLYDDGVRELEEIKRDMSSAFELPPLDFHRLNSNGRQSLLFTRFYTRTELTAGSDQ